MKELFSSKEKTSEKRMSEPLNHKGRCFDEFGNRFYYEERIRNAVEYLKEEVKKNPILESDLQTGNIEFSYTGELVPLERVYEIIDEAFEDVVKKEPFSLGKKNVHEKERR